MPNNNTIDTYIRTSLSRIKKILTKKHKRRILQKFDFKNYTQISTIIQRTNKVAQYVVDTIIYRQNRFQSIFA